MGDRQRSVSSKPCHLRKLFYLFQPVYSSLNWGFIDITDFWRALISHIVPVIEIWGKEETTLLLLICWVWISLHLKEGLLSLMFSNIILNDVKNTL